MSTLSDLDNTAVRVLRELATAQLGDGVPPAVRLEAAQTLLKLDGLLP